MSPNSSLELDFTSKYFDPVEFLKCSNRYLPYPNAKTYNNVAEWSSRTIFRKKTDGVSKKASKNVRFVLRRNYKWFFKTLGLDMPRDFDEKNRYLKCVGKKKRNSFGKYQIDKTLVVKEVPSEMLQPIRSSKIIIKRSNGTVRRYVFPNSSGISLEGMPEIENSGHTDKNTFNSSESGIFLSENNLSNCDKPISEIHVDGKCAKHPEMSLNLTTNSSNDGINYKISHSYNITQKYHKTSNSQAITGEIHYPIHKKLVLEPVKDPFSVLGNLVNSVSSSATPVQPSKVTTNVEMLENLSFCNENILSCRKALDGKENLETLDMPNTSKSYSTHKIKKSIPNKFIKHEIIHKITTEKQQCSIQNDISPELGNSILAKASYNALQCVSEESRSRGKTVDIINTENIPENLHSEADSKHTNEQLLNNKIGSLNYNKLSRCKSYVENMAKEEQYSIQKGPYCRSLNLNNISSTEANINCSTLNQVKEKHCSELTRSDMIKTKTVCNTKDNGIPENSCNEKESLSNKIAVTKKKQYSIQEDKKSLENTNSSISILKLLSEKACGALKVKITNTVDKNGCGAENSAEKLYNEIRFNSKQTNKQYLNHKIGISNYKIPLKSKSNLKVISKEKQYSVQENPNSEISFNPSCTSSIKSRTNCGSLKQVSEKPCSKVKRSDIINAKSKTARNAKDNRKNRFWKDILEFHNDNEPIPKKKSDNRKIKISSSNKTTVTQTENFSVQKDQNSRHTHALSVKSDTSYNALKLVSKKAGAEVKINLTDTENKNECNIENNAPVKLYNKAEPNSKQTGKRYVEDKIGMFDYSKSLKCKSSEVISKEWQGSFQKGTNSEINFNPASNEFETNHSILKQVSEKPSEAKWSGMINTENKGVNNTKDNTAKKSHGENVIISKMTNNNLNHTVKSSIYEKTAKGKRKAIKKQVKRNLNSELQKCDSHNILKSVSGNTNATVKEIINESKNSVEGKKASEKSCDKTKSDFKEKLAEVPNNQYPNHKIGNVANIPIKRKIVTEVMADKKQCSVLKDLNTNVQRCGSSCEVSTKSPDAVPGKTNTAVKEIINNESKNSNEGKKASEKSCDKTKSDFKEKLVEVPNSQYPNHKIGNVAKRPVKCKIDTQVIAEKEKCSVLKNLNTNVQHCDSSYEVSTESPDTVNAIYSVLHPDRGELHAHHVEMKVNSGKNTDIDDSGNSSSKNLYSETEISSKENFLLELARKARNKLHYQAR